MSASDRVNMQRGARRASGLAVIVCISAASPEAAQTTPQPAPEMQRLSKALAGRWSIRQDFEPQAGMPHGGVGQGTEVWRPGPGALSLVEELHTHIGDREASGLGVICWDPQGRGYRVIWCGSANPRGCIVMSKPHRLRHRSTWPTLQAEYVVYTAHVDHLGIGKPIDGDSIYNGAMDNASGTAALIEIAKVFSQLPRAPARSILFVAVTGEEKGLLGSDYYAHFPRFPRRRWSRTSIWTARKRCTTSRISSP